MDSILGTLDCLESQLMIVSGISETEDGLTSHSLFGRQPIKSGDIN